ncbi:MAG: DUF1574 family protein [Isosphaeraceae bacterium]
MSSNVPWFRNRRPPSGLIGAMLLIVVVEGVVSGYSLDVVRFEQWVWASAARAAQHDAPGCDTLALGSSMVLMGVLPQSIEQQTGGRVANLAVMGGITESSYFLLKRALDAGANPSRVIVDFHPYFLTEDHWQTSRMWPFLLDTQDTLDLAWTARDAEFFGVMTVARALPTLRVRYRLRTAILSAFQGTYQSLRTENLETLAKLNRNQGALPTPEDPSFQGVVGPHYGSMLLTQPWRCRPIHAKYLRKFLALTASKGIQVYWVIPPVAPNLQTWRDQRGLEVRYDQFVQALQAKAPHLVVVDGRRLDYQNAAFLDASHLGNRGAIAFSADLARCLDSERSSTGPRWLTLLRDQDHRVERFAEQDEVQNSREERRR